MGFFNSRREFNESISGFFYGARGFNESVLGFFDRSMDSTNPCSDSFMAHMDSMNPGRIRLRCAWIQRIHAWILLQWDEFNEFLHGFFYGERGFIESPYRWSYLLSVSTIARMTPFISFITLSFQNRITLYPCDSRYWVRSVSGSSCLICWLPSSSTINLFLIETKSTIYLPIACSVTHVT